MPEGIAAASEAVRDSADAKKTRRRFLIGATGAVGGVAGVLSAAPFVGSLRPSRKTQAAGAPARAGIDGLAAGELKTVVWRLKPVWIFGRSEKMIDDARAAAGELSDPDSENSLQPEYCKNPLRSIKPEIFIAVGLCTHLGCSPGRLPADEGEGFFCACHGSRFDVAGRVVRGSPAPSNLIIPPHHYASESEVVIGEDAGAAAA